MSLSFLGAGDPFQPGNGLRNKNFSKITFRALAIAALITALLAFAAYRFKERDRGRPQPNDRRTTSSTFASQPIRS